MLRYTNFCLELIFNFCVSMWQWNFHSYYKLTFNILRKCQLFLRWLHRFMGFPCGSVSKESTCNVGDLGLIPGLGRSPGEGKSYPLQYSCLENSMDWIVLGVAKSQTQLSDIILQSCSQCTMVSVLHILDKICICLIKKF